MALAVYNLYRYQRPRARAHVCIRPHHRAALVVRRELDAHRHNDGRRLEVAGRARLQRYLHVLLTGYVSNKILC